MIRQEDKKWLEKVLNSSFETSDAKVAREKKLLEDFGLLIKHMVKNTEKILDETRVLWEIEPESKELRRRFSMLEKCLSCLRRYCEKKIER